MFSPSQQIAYSALSINQPQEEEEEDEREHPSSFGTSEWKSNEWQWNTSTPTQETVYTEAEHTKSSTSSSNPVKSWPPALEHPSNTKSPTTNQYQTVGNTYTSSPAITKDDEVVAPYTTSLFSIDPRIATQTAINNLKYSPASLLMPRSKMVHSTVRRRVGLRTVYELVCGETGEIQLACVTLPTPGLLPRFLLLTRSAIDQISLMKKISTSSGSASNGNNAKKQKETNKASTSEAISSFFSNTFGTGWNQKRSSSSASASATLLNQRNRGLHMLPIETIHSLPWLAVLVPVQSVVYQKTYRLVGRSGNVLGVITAKSPSSMNQQPISLSCVVYPTDGQFLLSAADSRQVSATRSPPPPNSSNDATNGTRFSFMGGCFSDVSCMGEANGPRTYGKNDTRQYGYQSLTTHAFTSDTADESTSSSQSYHWMTFADSSHHLSSHHHHSSRTSNQDMQSHDNSTNSSISSKKLDGDHFVRSEHQDRTDGLETPDATDLPFDEFQSASFSRCSSSLDECPLHYPTRISTKAPAWNEEIRAWTHFFGGRVRRASPRNFLAYAMNGDDDGLNSSVSVCPNALDDQESEIICIRHGMLNDETFVLDYRAPISPAVALALATIAQSS